MDLYVTERILRGSKVSVPLRTGVPKLRITEWALVRIGVKCGPHSSIPVLYSHIPARAGAPQKVQITFLDGEEPGCVHFVRESGGRHYRLDLGQLGTYRKIDTMVVESMDWCGDSSTLIVPLPKYFTERLESITPPLKKHVSPRKPAPSKKPAAVAPVATMDEASQRVVDLAAKFKAQGHSESMILKLIDRAIGKL